ncbi:MAG TPA: ComEC/Rec2 family competence protein [Micromonosporaceae bacterium]|nr:ComEC/Rec2 family competence protein [Micromonosporaceae bacterium]
MSSHDSQRSGPDLRLAGPALGAWLAALWALHLPSGGAICLAVGAGCGALLLWYAGRRHLERDMPRRHGVAVGVMIGLLLGILSGAAATAARTATRDSPLLDRLIRQDATVRLDLVLTDDPRQLPGSRGRTWLVGARLTRLDTGPGTTTVRLSARVLVIGQHPGWRGALPGQRTSLAGRLAHSRGGDLRAAVVIAPDAPRFRGEPPLAQRAAGALRLGLQQAATPLPDEEGGLLPGLAVGDVSRMDPLVEEDFRTTGMTHLTAVSGSNVAIVTGLILLLAAWCRAGPRLSAALAVAALIGFVILVRPSPSVLRAAVMGTLGLVALASSRPRAAVPGLATSVYLLVVADPELAADPGFALSVLATAGLLLLAPRWRDALRRRRVPSGVAEALAVPIAAQVACAPVIASITGTVSLSAIPANLLAAPAVAPATVLGVAAAGVSPLWPAAAEFLAWLASWPALWLVLVARWGSDLPGLTLPWPAGVSGALLLAVVLCLLLVAGLLPATRRLLAVALVAALAGSVAVRTVAAGWPPPDWAFVACDVGQGDALVLSAGPGRAVLIDAGPDPSAVDRCLRRLGVRSLSLLVISHFHADHVDGLPGALRRRDLGTVVLPAFREPIPGAEQVLRTATLRRLSTLEVSPGWRYEQRGLRIEVLGPDRVEAGTRSDPNNNSLVLLATMPGLTILFPGDAEVERQQAMLAGGEPIRVDVLKVPHHGSSYQESGFLETTDPVVAVVSVGANNDYGHPSTELLDRLNRDGARVFRTDLAGDVALSRGPDGLMVTVHGKEPGQRTR